MRGDVGEAVQLLIAPQEIGVTLSELRRELSQLFLGAFGLGDVPGDQETLR